MHRPTIIGIAGASCSGKTTLAEAVAQRLGDTVTIGLDSYYHDLSHLHPETIHTYNLDEPAALEYELLVRNLEDLTGGRPTEKPVYDHKTHTRSEPVRIEPGRYVILEGLFTFFWEEVRRLLHRKIFIDADHDLCLRRRIDRDRSHRGRSEEEVRRRYRTMVQPNFERHVMPTRAHADVIVSGVAPLEETVTKIVDIIGG